MQSRYEILMLTVPDIAQDDVKGVESLLSDIIVKARGSVLSFERWGKYQLAYPVKKYEYGVYYLMRFEVPAGVAVVGDLKSLFSIRLGSSVMRFMITALDPNAPLAYQRPRSLEEAPPAREGGSGYFPRGERRSSYEKPDSGLSSSDQEDLMG